MKKMVSICDSCNMKVANTYCMLCGRDLCDLCKLFLYLGNSFFEIERHDSFAGNLQDKAHVRICMNCSEKISYTKKKRPLRDNKNCQKLLINFLKEIIYENEKYDMQQGL